MAYPYWYAEGVIFYRPQIPYKYEVPYETVIKEVAKLTGWSLDKAEDEFESWYLNAGEEHWFVLDENAPEWAFDAAEWWNRGPDVYVVDVDEAGLFLEQKGVLGKDEDIYDWFGRAEGFIDTDINGMTFVIEKGSEAVRELEIE